MAAAHDTWTVLPHGPIEKLEENLWRVEGSIPNMPLKRVMTLARRSDGGVVVHNAIALDEASMKQIEAWGRPAYLVVPNGWHRLDAKVFHQRYPEAKVVAPAGSRKRVEQVVAVDTTYAEYPKDRDVELVHLEGTGDAEGVLQVRSAGGLTLVFNDVIFNLPHEGGLMGFVSRYVLGSTGGPKVTRVSRLFVLKDAAAFRGQLERLAALPGLKRVIVSHGRVIDQQAAEILKGIAATL